MGDAARPSRRSDCAGRRYQIDARLMLGEKRSKRLDIGPVGRERHADDLDAMGAQQRKIEIAGIVDNDVVAGRQKKRTTDRAIAWRNSASSDLGRVDRGAPLGKPRCISRRSGAKTKRRVVAQLAGAGPRARARTALIETGGRKPNLGQPAGAGCSKSGRRQRATHQTDPSRDRAAGK